MINITGVFQFLEDNYNVNLNSVLHCNPSFANQIVCLVFAGVAMEMFIYFLAGFVKACINRSSNSVKDNLLTAKTNLLKNEVFANYIINEFNDWCKKHPCETKCIKDQPTMEDFVKRVGSTSDFKSLDEAVEAYMNSSDSMRNLWRDYAVDSQAVEFAMCTQHLVAGTFALYAVELTNSEDLFLTYGRWGVLCEAGWELFDTMKHILYPIVVGEFDSRSFMLILHHVTLFLVFPLNRFLLPSKIGRDVAIATFLYAGVPGLLGPVGLLKRSIDIDITKPKGKFFYMMLSTVPSLLFMPTRSVHWTYFAYKILKFAWDEKVSWPAFLIYILIVVMFSLFNVSVILFSYKGMVKAIQKIQPSSEKVQVQKESNKGSDAALLPRISRKSSFANTQMALEANTTNHRVSRKRSISRMGLDYDLSELDEDEVAQIEERTSLTVSARQHKSSCGNNIFSSVGPIDPAPPLMGLDYEEDEDELSDTEKPSDKKVL